MLGMLTSYDEYLQQAAGAISQVVGPQVLRGLFGPEAKIPLMVPAAEDYGLDEEEFWERLCESPASGGKSTAEKERLASLGTNMLERMQSLHGRLAGLPWTTHQGSLQVPHSRVGGCIHRKQRRVPGPPLAISKTSEPRPMDVSRTHASTHGLGTRWLEPKLLKMMMMMVVVMMF